MTVVATQGFTGKAAGFAESMLEECELRMLGGGGGLVA